MSRSRSFLTTFHRPAWQEQLPPAVRVAAETQFGTWALAAVIMLVRGQFAGAAVMAMLGAFFFTFLAGWLESRRINSPPVWWACVVVATALGVGAVVGAIFGDVS